MTEREREEAIEALRGQCDSVGECDRCHHEGPLWEDMTQEGEFEFCLSCWGKYLGLPWCDPLLTTQRGL